MNTVAWSKRFESFVKLMSKIGSASLCSRAGRYDNPIRTRFLASLIADSPDFVDAKREEGLREALLNRILAP